MSEHIISAWMRLRTAIVQLWEALWNAGAARWSSLVVLLHPRTVWRRGLDHDWRGTARWAMRQYRTSSQWWIGHVALALFLALCWYAGVRLPVPQQMGANATSANLQKLQQMQEPPDPATGLHVLAVTPSGAVDTNLAELKFLFDHPMVAMTDVDPDKHPTLPLQITPPVAGEFVWFGTQGAKYRLTEPLQSATQYTVTLPDGLRALDGATLADAFTWTFATTAPQVVEASPDVGQAYVLPTAPVSVVFSQPLQRAAVEAAWVCRVWDGALSTKERQEQPSRPCRTAWSFAWEDLPKGYQRLTAMPKSPYPDGRTIEIALPHNIPAVRGNLGLAAAWTLPFTTSGGFELERIYIAHPYPTGDYESPVGTLYQVDPPEGERQVTPDKYLQPTGDICFTFSEPLDRAAFERAVTIAARDADGAAANFRPQFYYEDSTHATDDDRARAATSNDLPHLTGCVTADLRYFRNYELRLREPLRDRRGRVVSNAKLPTTIPFRTMHGTVEGSLNVTRPILSAAHLPQLPFTSLNAEKMTVVLRRCSDSLAARVWSKNADCRTDAENAQGEESGEVTDSEAPLADTDPSARTVAIDAPYDHYHQGTIDLQKLYGPLAPGVYDVSLTLYPLSEITLRKKSKNAGIDQERIVNADPVTVSQTILVTNTMLVLQHAQNQVHVTALDIETGAPRAAVPVQMWTGESLLASGMTDARGMFSTVNNALAPQSSIQMVVDHPQYFSIVTDTDTDGIAPEDFAVAYERPRYLKNHYLFWHTDRPIYRPGQTVEFGGFLRAVQDGQYTVSQSVRDLPVTISDPSGTQVWQQTLSLSATGVVNGSWQLGDATIPRGAYRLTAHVPTVTWSGEAAEQTFTAVFYVASYKKPDFKVTMTPAAQDVLAGDPLTLDARAEYFFGAPLANATVQWSIRQEGFRFAPAAYPHYQFIDDEAVRTHLKTYDDGSEALDESYVSDFGEIAAGVRSTDSASRRDDPKVHDPVAHALKRLGNRDTVADADDVTLTDDGRLQITHTTNLSAVATSQIYTAVVTAAEWGTEISAVSDVKVHKASVYVGLKPQRLVVRSGEPVVCDVVTLTPQEKPAPQQTVQLALWHREYMTVKRRTDRGAWTFDSEPRDTLVHETSVTTDARGAAVVTLPAEGGGAFRVVATVRDARERTNTAAVQIGVGDSAGAAWPETGADRVMLLADKPQYRVGDTATLLIPMPTNGMKALVSVERAGILDQQTVTLTGDNNLLQIPIRESFVPNAYVHVVLLNPGRQGPAWAKVGLAELQVEPDRKRLQISVTPDRASYAPKDKVTLTIRTNDHAGRGVPADVIVGVADESVLRLVDYRSPDLVRRFYFPRALGVWTAENMLHFKSGDGGDEPADQAKKRNKFLDTAFFRAPVRTDAQGIARVEFTLPDNITTWIAEGFGITDDTRVGSAFTPMRSIVPTFIRPTLPRFLGVEDAAQPVVFLENLTDAPFAGTLDAVVRGGAALRSDATQAIHVRPHDRTPIRLALEATAPQNAKLTLTTRNAQRVVVDQIEQTLPVYDRSVPIVYTASGATREPTRQQLTVPAGVRTDRGGLQLDVSRAPWALLEETLTHLIAFPYGCAEQRASALFAMSVLVQWLANDAAPLPEAIRAAYAAAIKTVPADVTSEQVTARMGRAVQSLLPFQQSDGGFVLWREEPDVDPLLTADVARLFAWLQRSGVPIPDTARDPITQFLSDLLSRQRALGVAASARPMRAVDRNAEQIAADSRAYIAWALAQLDPARARVHVESIADTVKVMGPRGLASLLLAVDALGTERTNAATVGAQAAQKALLRAQVPLTGVRDALLWHDPQGVWDDLTTTAVAVQALHVAGAIDARDGGIAALTRQATARTASTRALREVLLALRAAAAPTEAGAADVTARLLWNGQAQDIPLSRDLTRWFTQYTPVADIGAGEQTLELTPPDARTPLYYRAALTTYFPMAQVPRREDGMIIAREWYALDDLHEATPLTTFEQGKNYKATLTVLLPRGYSQLAVEHLLPAGFEPVDFGLTTSNPELQQALADAATQDKSPTLTPPEFGHVETQDDRVMWTANWAGSGVYKLRHVARAATPGTYQAPGATAYPFYAPDIGGRSRSMVVTVKE